MSPEQAEGAPVGMASDIFSLGAVLAFATTGEGPFGTGNTAALVYRVVHSQPNLGGIPDGIRPLVERCLAKDPAERPGPDAILTELSDAVPLMTGLTGWLPAAIAESFQSHAPPPEPAPNLTADDAALGHSTAETLARPRTPPASQESQAADPAASATQTSRRSPPLAGGASQPPAPPRPPGDLEPPGSRQKPPARRPGPRLLWAAGAIAVAAAVAAVFTLPHVIGVSAAAHSRRTRQAMPTTSTGAAGPASVAPTASKSPAKASRSSHTAAQRHASAHSPSTTKIASQPSGTKTTASPPKSTSNPQPVGGSPPPPVSSVGATALSQYQVKVVWSESSANVTGFNVDNGCPVGACGGPDAEAYTTTGRVNSTTFTVTPGSYTCFRVQAFNTYGDSAWSGYACRSTPSFHVPGTQAWIDTGVYMNSGDRLGIKAVGTVYIDPSYPVGPGGVSSCVPSTTYPNLTFPAPHLYCWSLIARVGNGTPFEVGASAFLRTGAGELYLGVNDNNFTDNSGSWTVNIARGGQATTP